MKIKIILDYLFFFVKIFDFNDLKAVEFYE